MFPERRGVLVSSAELYSLREFMQKECIRQGDFTLASGLPAKYYYNGKIATLRPEMARIIGRVVLRMVREAGAEGAGGMSIGADPIAQSIALSSLDDGGLPIPAFIVRKEAKTHGTKDQTAAGLANDGGELLTVGRKVAVVDDVITTGGSITEAIDVVKSMGCEVVLVVAIVERHEQGGQKLASEGYNFKRLFYTDKDGNLSIDREMLQRATGLPGEPVLR